MVCVARIKAESKKSLTKANKDLLLWIQEVYM